MLVYVSVISKMIGVQLESGQAYWLNVDIPSFYYRFISVGMLVSRMLSSKLIKLLKQKYTDSAFSAVKIQFNISVTGTENTFSRE